jgi:hypothetical protein
MMELKDKVVHFHLSQVGTDALAALIGQRSFEAFVLDTDTVGAWVMWGASTGGPREPAVPVLLVKWDYIASVGLDVRIGDEGETFTIDINGD